MRYTECRKEVSVMNPDNNSSASPLSTNDFQYIPNVLRCCSEQSHACPFATTCNPLRVEYMEQKLRNAIAYLDGWANGAYIVSIDSNDFDVLRHRYDLRAVIAGLNVILHEALGRPLGDLPRWQGQYPVHLPDDKSRKGRD